jgi:hypothetical protein
MGEVRVVGSSEGKSEVGVGVGVGGWSVGVRAQGRQMDVRVNE